MWRTRTGLLPSRRTSRWCRRQSLRVTRAGLAGAFGAQGESGFIPQRPRSGGQQPFPSGAAALPVAVFSTPPGSNPQPSRNNKRPGRKRAISPHTEYLLDALVYQVAARFAVYPYLSPFILRFSSVLCTQPDDHRRQDDREKSGCPEKRIPPRIARRTGRSAGGRERGVAARAGTAGAPSPAAVFINTRTPILVPPRPEREEKVSFAFHLNG